MGIEISRAGEHPAPYIESDSTPAPWILNGVSLYLIRLIKHDRIGMGWKSFGPVLG